MPADSAQRPFPSAVPDGWALPAVWPALRSWLARLPPPLWMIGTAVLLGLGGGLAATSIARHDGATSRAEQLVPAAVRVATPTTAPPPLLVHVAGAVAQPGLHEVADGGRVADALAAAGGPRPDADTSRLNLAAPLADGSRIYVPTPGETPPAVLEPTDDPATVSAGGPPGRTDGQVVDLNTASEQELDGLPGVGPATAAAIVRARQAHPFASVDDLLAVPGIGPAKLEALRSRVRV